MRKAPMSKRLETLHAAYEKAHDLSSLIEYLEQAYQENEHRLAIETIETWEKERTPEIDFYLGAALFGIGRHAEATERLKAVLAVNPHHFRARKKLEEIGADGRAGEEAPATQKDGKQIRLPEIPTSETEHYRKAGHRTLAVTLLLVTAVTAAVLLLIGERTSGAERLLADPEAALWPIRYPQFERQVEELRSLEQRFPEEDAPRKALFYLTAFALLDYRLFDREELLTQARFYYTLVTGKDPAMTQLLDYLEGNDLSSPLAAGHRRDTAVLGDPQKAFTGPDPHIPAPVTAANLRAAWYDALLFYRLGRWDDALKTSEAILAAFPDAELPQKLRVAAIARKAEDRSKTADSTRTIGNEEIQKLSAVLSRWRAASEERYFLSEAYVALGRAANDLAFEKEGFYLGCPGQTFCAEVIAAFVARNRTEEAKRMALFVKEKKGLARTADDLLLVMRVSMQDGDFGNCYFSFKEIQQFFPDRTDEKTMRDGAFCCEKENYLEEALGLYEKIGASAKDPTIEAKIAEMRYLIRRDPQSAQTLKSLAERNPDDPLVLNSYLSVLLKGNNLPEISAVLERIYALTPAGRRVTVIDRFLQAGLVSRAAALLAENRDRREARERLYDLYNRYFLFGEADAVAGKEENLSTPFWRAFRTEYDRLNADTAAAVAETLEKMDQGMEQKCFPPLLYLKAEAFRRAGNTQKTLSLRDGLLECDRTYFPGLLFAAEMAYYQGDISRAIISVTYLLDRETILWPGRPVYHNYLVLLLAEMSIVKGREKKALDLLTRSLDRTLPWGTREKEKLQDLYDKSKTVLKKRIEQIIAERFGA